MLSDMFADFKMCKIKKMYLFTLTGKRGFDTGVLQCVVTVCSQWLVYILLMTACVTYEGVNWIVIIMYVIDQWIVALTLESSALMGVRFSFIQYFSCFRVSKDTGIWGAFIRCCILDTENLQKKNEKWSASLQIAHKFTLFYCF